MQLRIELFGETKCPKSYRIRDFLQRNDLHFEWTEIARNEDALLHTGLDSLSKNRRF
jgi:glutaredoxin-related protein